MPLDFVNTVAAILTTTIIAATAIAALLQLRHMRGEPDRRIHDVTEHAGRRRASARRCDSRARG